MFTSQEGTLDGLSFAVFIKSEEGKPDEPVISYAGADGLDDVEDRFAAAAEGGVAQT